MAQSHICSQELGVENTSQKNINMFDVINKKYFLCSLTC
jgi:hypothetical protein